MLNSAGRSEELSPEPSIQIPIYHQIPTIKVDVSTPVNKETRLRLETLAQELAKAVSPRK
jgi:hypothetical protein